MSNQIMSICILIILAWASFQSECWFVQPTNLSPPGVPSPVSPFSFQRADWILFVFVFVVNTYFVQPTKLSPPEAPSPVSPFFFLTWQFNFCILFWYFHILFFCLVGCHPEFHLRFQPFLSNARIEFYDDKEFGSKSYLHKITQIIRDKTNWWAGWKECTNFIMVTCH